MRTLKQVFEEKLDEQFECDPNKHVIVSQALACFRKAERQLSDEWEQDRIKKNFNPRDYVVLDSERNFRYLSKNQIAVGIRNFLLGNQPVLMEYEYQGQKYKRLHTDSIPNELAGDICSVQIYELIK